MTKDSRTVVTPIRVLFFCGERSPYGFAHLHPLLMEKRFTVTGVVFATEERWERFRQALSGRLPENPSLFQKGFRFVKQVAKRVLGRSGNTAAAISLCRDHNVPFFFIHDVNSQESLELFSKLYPQLILCAAYPQIFKRPLLNLAPLGAVNSHPSLLPRYRGAHPHFWALAQGEKFTGVSLHYMTEKVDCGDIIVQIPIVIEDADTYSSLYQKIIAVIPDCISKLADFMLDESKKAIPQDNSKATFFRNDREIHHCILWSIYTAEQIRNLVRACNGRAYFWVGGVKVLVEECTVDKTNRNLTNNIVVPPGTIVDVSRDKVSVKAKEGVVTLQRYRVQGFHRVKFAVGRILI